MAQAPITFPDLALDKFSGDDPGQNPASFLNLVENKIDFSLGRRPNAGDDRNHYDFRKKSLFASLLRGSAADWYRISVTNATTWDNLTEAFKTRFTDNRDKYQYRMMCDNIKREPNEFIKNYFARVKVAVDRGWPIDLTNVAADDQDAARERQNTILQQKYIEIAIRGLEPIELKQKAYKWVNQNPNAQFEAVKNEIITKDQTYTLTAPNKSTQDSDRLQSLENKLSEVLTLVQKKEVNEISNSQHFGNNNSYNQQPYNRSFQNNPRPNPSRFRQNATRFCKYCKRNGHTIQFCNERKTQERNQALMRRQQSIPRRTFSNNYRINRQNSSFRPNYGRSISRESTPTRSTQISRSYRNPNREYPRDRSHSNERYSTTQRTPPRSPSRSSRPLQITRNPNHPRNTEMGPSVRFIDEDNSTEINMIDADEYDTYPPEKHYTSTSSQHFRQSAPSRRNSYDDQPHQIASSNFHTPQFELIEIKEDLFSLNGHYAHCVSTDFEMGAGIAYDFTQLFPKMKPDLKTRYVFPGDCSEYYDPTTQRWIYNLVTKVHCYDKPELQDIEYALSSMRDHMLRHRIKSVSMPRIGCGLDQQHWSDIRRILYDVFSDTDIRIRVCELKESDQPRSRSRTISESQHNSNQLFFPEPSEELNVVSEDEPETNGYSEIPTRPQTLPLAEPTAHIEPTPPYRSIPLFHPNFRFREYTTNLFISEHSMAHCITTDYSMGNGIGRQFDYHFPGMKRNLSFLSTYPGDVREYYDNSRSRWIFNLVTKRYCHDHAEFKHLELCLRNLKQHILRQGIYKLAIPKFPSGRDYDWNLIKGLFGKLFHDVDIEISVFDIGMKSASRLFLPEETVEHQIIELPEDFTTMHRVQKQHLAIISPQNQQPPTGYIFHPLERYIRYYFPKMSNYISQMNPILTDAIPFYDTNKERLVYNLIAKTDYNSKVPSLKTLEKCFEKLCEHAIESRVREITICPDDFLYEHLKWGDIQRIISRTFENSRVLIFAFTGKAVTFHSPTSPPEKSEIPLTFDEDNEINVISNPLN